MKAKKSVFDLNFDTSVQPGYETRFLSMDGFLGGGKINASYEKMDTRFADQRDLRKVFKSWKAPQMLPSYWAKVKGKV